MSTYDDRAAWAAEDRAEAADAERHDRECRCRRCGPNRFEMRVARYADTFVAALQRDRRVA